mmetsp:Transcript_20888/g.73710  ORF Transcript_20888/g.73710 Transcript_20888/m.73710 type:complete len:249 (-) Transcript_20888:545-1291(-)
MPSSATSPTAIVARARRSSRIRPCSPGTTSSGGHWITSRASCPRRRSSTSLTTQRCGTRRPCGKPSCGRLAGTQRTSSRCFETSSEVGQRARRWANRCSSGSALPRWSSATHCGRLSWTRTRGCGPRFRGASMRCWSARMRAASRTQTRWRPRLGSHQRATRVPSSWSARRQHSGTRATPSRQLTSATRCGGMPRACRRRRSWAEATTRLRSRARPASTQRQTTSPSRSSSSTRGPTRTRRTTPCGSG